MVVLKNCEPEISYILAARSTLQYMSEGVSFSRLLEGGYWWSFSRSSDRIARAFNRSGATRAGALDISI